MKELNKTQKKIYEFLAERSQNGVPPSVREICAAVGLKSTSSVQANLDALEEAGYIERDPMLKRSIRVTGQTSHYTQVPLLGTVTAGMPILAVEAIEGYVPFAGQCDADKPLFALKVRGDSMIKAGILSGDIIIKVAPGWRLLNEDNQETFYSRTGFIPFPIIFYGAGTEAEHVAIPVTTDRIAPTIAKSIRIRAPNACTAEPLF